MTRHLWCLTALARWLSAGNRQRSVGAERERRQWCSGAGAGPAPGSEHPAQDQPISRQHEYSGAHVCRERLVYAGSFGHGLFRSEDRGDTWSKSGQRRADRSLYSDVSPRGKTVRFMREPSVAVSFVRVTREELAGDQ